MSTDLPEPLEHENPSQDARADSTTRFVELLTSHQQKLYAYISTLLMGDAAAADVLQDTNIDLWARSKDFDFQRPFLPWAFAFARQRVMAFRKSQSRSRLLFSETAMAMIEKECAQLASDADRRMSALKQCLKKLSPSQMHLIVERYHAKTSVKMIAARLGESAHNVASQLHRIRQSLARCIDSSLAAEDRR